MAAAVIWEHHDKNMLTACEMFLAYAEQQKFRALAASEGRRAIRGGIFLSLIAANQAFNAASFQDPFDLDAVTVGDLPAEGFPTAEHKLAAQTILGTWVLLAQGKKPKLLPITTHDGGPPTYGAAPEAGWLMLVRLAASAVWAVAACYVAAEYEDTVDRALKRGDVTDRLLDAQAKATMVLHDHGTKEREMGMSVPYSPEEAAVLNTLIEHQKTFASTPEAPKNSPLPKGPGFLGGLGVGAVVVAGLVVWAMTRKG